MTDRSDNKTVNTDFPFAIGNGSSKVLSKQPLSLKWRQLSVFSKQRSNGILSSIRGAKYKETKNILHSVSGEAHSGSLTAIIGSSGSGKTTLLAALSKKLHKNVTGQILLNERTFTPEDMNRISGHLPQHEIAVEELTVMEHLNFMSELKIGRSKQRLQKIYNLLQEFNLLSSSNSQLRVLSGGERKKLALAIELLTHPAILFCDEPTTGLDSWAALGVISKLCDLAASGVIVLCTIHQPASNLFEYFTDLIILSAGRVAYQGPRKEASAFFSSLGFDCPQHFNPAEFYVKQVSYTASCDTEQNGRPLQRIFDAFDSLSRQRDESQQTQEEAPGKLIFHKNDRRISTRAGWFRQTYLLTKRHSICFRRNISTSVNETAINLIACVVLSLTFLGMERGPITQHTVQNVRGALFMVSSEILYTAAYSVMYFFPANMSLMRRERGLYSSSAYYVSYIASLIPKTFIEPFLYLSIVYHSVEYMYGFSTYFTMGILLSASVFCANAYGCMLSALVGNTRLVVEVAVPIEVIMLVLAGMYINLRALPPYLKTLKILSMFFYANEGLAVLHWSQVNEISCPNNTNFPCLKSGEDVLMEYGFNVYKMAPRNSSEPIGLISEMSELFGFISSDLYGLLIIALVMHIVAYFGLLRQSRQEASY